MDIILTAAAFLVTFLGVWVTERAWAQRRGIEKQRREVEREVAMERVVGRGLGRGRR